MQHRRINRPFSFQAPRYRLLPEIENLDSAVLASSVQKLTVLLEADGSYVTVEVLERAADLIVLIDVVDFGAVAETSR